MFKSETTEQFRLKNEQKRQAMESKITARREKVVTKRSATLTNLTAKLEQKHARLEQKHADTLAKITQRYEMKRQQLVANHAPKYKIERITRKLQSKLQTLKASQSMTLQLVVKQQQDDLTKFNSKTEYLLKNIDFEIEGTNDSFNEAYSRRKQQHDDALTKKTEKQQYAENYKIQKQVLINKLDQSIDRNEVRELRFEKRHLAWTLATETCSIYKPWNVKLTGSFVKMWLMWVNKFWEIISGIKHLRYVRFKDIFYYRIWEMPLWLFLIIFVIAGLALCLKEIPSTVHYTDKGIAQHIGTTIGGLGVMLVLAIVIGTITNKIPIWKSYIGGGTMGCLIIGAVLMLNGVLPKGASQPLKLWFSTSDFLNLFIDILIVGSIISVPRKTLLRSFGGFFSLIVIAIIFAIIFGLIGMAIFNISLSQLFMYYIIPILENGNGGGAIPLKAAVQSAAEAKGISADIAGKMSNDFYTKILAIITIANIITVIFAAVVGKIGDAQPKLSGNGKLMKKEIKVYEEDVKINDRYLAASLCLAIAIYLIANLMAKLWLTPARLNGVTIPTVAWVVVITIVLTAIGIIPRNLAKASKVVQGFFSKSFLWVIMLGVGFGIDLNLFAQQFTLQNVIMIILIVFGVVIGPYLFANMFRFYATESVLAAGLSMSGMGGAGALAVLGVSNRMNLVSYSQISCRIAGSIVLIVGCVLITPCWSAFQAFM